MFSNMNRLEILRDPEGWCGDVRATVTTDATVWDAVWVESEDKVAEDIKRMLDALVGIVAGPVGINQRMLRKCRVDVRNERIYRQANSDRADLYEVLFPDHVLGQDPLDDKALFAITPAVLEASLQGARGAIRNVIVFAEGAQLSELLLAAVGVMEDIEPNNTRPVMAAIPDDRYYQGYQWRWSATPRVVTGISLPPLATAYPERATHARMALLSFMSESYVQDGHGESILPAASTTAAGRMYTGSRPNVNPWVFRDAARVEEALEAFHHFLDKRMGFFRQYFDIQWETAQARGSEDSILPVRLIQLADREQLEISEVLAAAADLTVADIDVLIEELSSAQRRGVLYCGPDEPVEL
jgi:hypothetical protein